MRSTMMLAPATLSSRTFSPPYSSSCCSRSCSSRSSFSSVLSRLKLNTRMPRNRSSRMKLPNSIHSTKKMLAAGPAPLMAIHMAWYHCVPVSISNTMRNESHMLSKFLRDPAKPLLPPNSCMPSTAKMNRKSSSTSRKSVMADSPLTMVSMSALMPLYARRILSDRSTRIRRNVRSTDRELLALASSTSPMTTMKASKQLKRSPKYSKLPSPATLSSISRVNTRLSTRLHRVSMDSSVVSMPWCSTAMVRVLNTMQPVMNWPNHGWVTTRRSRRWYPHLLVKKRLVLMYHGRRLSLAQSHFLNLPSAPEPVLCSIMEVCWNLAVITAVSSDMVKKLPNTTSMEKYILTTTLAPVAASTWDATSLQPLRVSVWKMVRLAHAMLSKLVKPVLGSPPLSRHTSPPPASHCRPRPPPPPPRPTQRHS
mmetsp:Transcript_39826/g.98561  ORF Transcript_39826/g.98561 Transcript_39826/m.98561 type:complete len:423 (+) Transcript_39826:236-1504(+)